MYTASLTNKVRFRTSRTERGLKSVAAEIVKGNDNGKNKVLQIKLDYGRHFEPIALQRYKTFMKLNNRPIQVEKCGLVIDSENYVSGASPDGKVIDIADPSAFGIIEIKCSEEYKDIDPKDICFIAKDSCLVFSDGKVQLNKRHSYYDHIQMQLALTTQTWCDFVFYTSKGLVIDLIRFDKDYWEELVLQILNFYFTYMFDQLIEKSKKQG